MPVTIEIQNLQKKIPLRVLVLKKTILKILKNQRQTQGQLSFVFVTDHKMRQLNKAFLSHDYPTDVITFDWQERALTPAKSLNGEIIISVQTALRQSKLFKTAFEMEVLLYMVHGILHLLGYDDHAPSDIIRMRAQEDRWMAVVRK